MSKTITSVALMLALGLAACEGSSAGSGLQESEPEPVVVEEEPTGKF